MRVWTTTTMRVCTLLVRMCVVCASLCISVLEPHISAFSFFFFVLLAAAAAAVRIMSSVSHRPSSSQALVLCGGALCVVVATVQQQSHIKFCLLWRPRTVHQFVCACACACACHVSYGNEHTNLKRGPGARMLRRGSTAIQTPHLLPRDLLKQPRSHGYNSSSGTAALQQHYYWGAIP